MDITISLTKEQEAVISRAFPKQKPGDAAAALADIMMDEILLLLDGRKRYLSLSHQYIEWIERIYERTSPNEEYKQTRLENDFRFPPGTASYLVRVLRSRQNTSIHAKAISEVGKLLWDLYSDCKGKLPGAGANSPSRRLSTRAGTILAGLFDTILDSDANSAVGMLNITSRSPNYIQCTLTLQHIHDLVNVFIGQFPAEAKSLGMANAKTLAA